MLGASRIARSTLLEDLQTYNEVCTLLGDLQKTIKSTLLKDLEICFTY